MLICRRYRFDSWVRKSPWRRSWQHSKSLSGKSRTEELGGLQSIRSRRVGHDWVATKTDAVVHQRYLLHSCSAGEDKPCPLWAQRDHLGSGVSEPLGLQSPCFLVKAGTHVGCSDSEGPQEQWTGKPHIWLQLALVCFPVLHTDDHPGCQRGDGPSFCRPLPGWCGRQAPVKGWGRCSINWPLFLLVWALWRGFIGSRHALSFLLCLLLLHQQYGFVPARNLCSPKASNTHPWTRHFWGG